MSEYGRTSLGTFYDGSAGENFIQTIYEARGDIIKHLPEGMYGHDLYNETKGKYVEVEHRQALIFDPDSIQRWLSDGYFLHIPERRIKVGGPQFDLVVLSADYGCSIIVHPYLVDWSTVRKDFIDCTGRSDGKMYLLDLNGDNYGTVWSQFHP